MYVAKVEVSDLDAMVSIPGTDEGKEFVKSWSIYVDSKAIFTLGYFNYGHVKLSVVLQCSVIMSYFPSKTILQTGDLLAESTVLAYINEPQVCSGSWDAQLI